MEGERVPLEEGGDEEHSMADNWACEGDERGRERMNGMT